MSAVTAAGRSLPVRNPRTGENDYAIRPLDEAALCALAARMRRAQRPWAAATVGHRVAVLREWSGALLGDCKALL
ncbi:MAG: hypothetical protein L6Q83_07740, partial [Gammaproteobacteria bacterium]|nr:hypothetical protein [Gammaproteobacteria bacterium]